MPIRSQQALNEPCNHDRAHDQEDRVQPRPRVLVVDDDRAVRDSLQRALKLRGYDVELAADGMEAIASVGSNAPDVVVLDVMMPGVDGLGVVRRLRQDGHELPILLLTARDAVPDRVAGLGSGADDYLVKPFALDELAARLEALLRRSGPQEPGAVRRFADLELDVDAVTVTRDGVPIELTRTEFDLLTAFVDEPRRVHTRDQLHARVWGLDSDVSPNNVEVYVGYLRRKLEAGGRPRLIQTVRGFGYALRAP
jgi:two-component system, OmpR family, response regulator MprA